jgi:hypothetical protein
MSLFLAQVWQISKSQEAEDSPKFRQMCEMLYIECLLLDVKARREGLTLTVRAPKKAKLEKRLRKYAAQLE